MLESALPQPDTSTPSPVSGGGSGGGGVSVYLETFGCQMNTLDSQLVTGQLRALGYRFTDDWKSADVVLYNTCSVREAAENKVWSRIGLMGKHQAAQAAQGKVPGVLGVIGCMAERDGADLMRRHPQVDLLCGPGELDKVPMLIDNALRTRLLDDDPTPPPSDPTPPLNPSAGEAAGTPAPRTRLQRIALQGNTHRRGATLAAAEDQLELVDLSRSFSPRDAQGQLPGAAYVRITRGCNKLCTYCVVPFTRGAEVHRPPDHIVDECRKLADAGVIEVTLLGQTVNHYHYDEAAAVLIHGIRQPQVGTVISPNTGNGGPSPVFNATTTSFARLLRRIHDEVPALQRIRFVTSLPRDFGDDILEAIRDCPRLCRYLHLPVQSGSNRILKMMNRGYRVEQYYELIERIRAYLPGAELATDIICGFPTETEEDHQATAELLRRCRFKNAYIFKYSPRPGTVAHDRLADDVPPDVKKRRNNELLAIQLAVSAEVHRAYVGKTVRVFVEQVSARTQRDQQRATAHAAGGGIVELGWEKKAGHVAVLEPGGPGGPGVVTQLSGRTGGDLIVMFAGDPSRIGSIVEVRITSSAPLALFGTMVERCEAQA